MGAVCTICAHPERDAMDRAIVSGTSYRGVAAQWHVGREAVRRHAIRHLSAALAAVRTQAQDDRRASLLDRIETLIERGEAMFAAAAADGKASQALAVLKELRGLLELFGRATGELRSDTPTVTINLATMPEWIAVRSAMFDALRPYPEARAVVSGRLHQLEAGDS
jgi:hypothetical protein